MPINKSNKIFKTLKPITMKKLTIFLLLVFSVVSCTKETNLNLSVEKENFDINYLTNLEEMSALQIILEQQQNNIFNTAGDVQSQIASMDEQRFEYLLRNENLNQSEQAEFEIILNTLGFNDLDMFNEYNTLLHSLKAKFEVQTNFETKSHEEQVAIMESFFQGQSIDQIIRRDDPTTLAGCQSQRDQCLQDAENARVNCIALCAAGGTILAFAGLFTGGATTAVAYFGSAACMAGCQTVYNIEAAGCNNTYDDCVANLPG